jgi:signal transduction histidine kinase/ActR/RegA family two-component response regulator
MLMARIERFRTGARSMEESISLILIHNAALLITMAYIYSLLSVYEKEYNSQWIRLFLGVMVSAIGLSIMLTSWEMQPGLMFDTRTVLLAASGLYLGSIPTLLAMLTMAVFRYAVGGDGMLAGICIILCSGFAGLVWRHFRRTHLADLSWTELYLFGGATHLLMIPSLLLLPAPVSLMQTVGVPFILLYPAATMLLGRMLAHRLQRERDAARIIEDLKEQKRLQARLQDAQKMEAVGRLAGGVAHEYNNKLQVVLGFSEIALRRIRNDPDMQMYLEEIQGAARQSARLTTQLMIFARKQPVHPCVCNLNQIVEQLLKMLRKVAGEDIEICWKPATDPGPVLVDPLQIDQVLISLTVNARNAMRDTGCLTVETRNLTLTEDCVQTIPDARPGDYVMLSFTDTGKGLAPETLAHLFEPFYSPQDDATASPELGLAVVYSVVQLNHGFIHVHSALDEGTSFQLYFPRAQEEEKEMPSNPLPAAERQKTATGKGETVLVVDDDKFVLDVIRLALKGQGYLVLAANNPTEALEFAGNPEQRFDLMITDVIMPDMNGRALYDEIEKRHHSLRVIYISGYTAESVIQRGVLDQGVEFFQKPFSVKELCQKVHELLAADQAN